jgi:hypothetical protein
MDGGAHINAPGAIDRLATPSRAVCRLRVGATDMATLTETANDWGVASLSMSRKCHGGYSRVCATSIETNARSGSAHGNHTTPHHTRQHTLVTSGQPT